MGRQGEAGKPSRDYGDQLFQIATDLFTLEVVADPKPEDLKRIHPGQQALVLALDLHSAGMTGVVKEIKDSQVIVEFASATPSIKPGNARRRAPPVRLSAARYNTLRNTAMEFLANSLLELITQTSTNLPPDVRAAMAAVANDETPGTQSSQALDIILSNVDMAVDDEGPICQDTGMPTFFVHTPVGVNQIRIRKAIVEASPKRRGAANFARTRSTRSPARTAATISAKRRR